MPRFIGDKSRIDLLILSPCNLLIVPWGYALCPKRGINNRDELCSVEESQGVLYEAFHD